MKHIKTLLFIFLSLFLCHAPVCKEFRNYKSFNLKNGLQVIVLPNSRAPVVYHSLWYKVGSADSPFDKSGLAHFLEHLMFKGSQKFPKDSFKRKINDLGGDQNANTTWDRTAYFVTIAKEHLPVVMEMEADRMQNLNITQEELEKEKEVVLQERRSTSDTDPFQRLNEAANAAFFWQHPYGKPVIGFEEHIRQYTLEDAKAFYNTWYGPNNAILVIAGDVDPNQVKDWVQKYYGAIPPKKIPERKRPIEPTHRSVTSKVEIRDPQLGGITFQRIYAAPNHRHNARQEVVLTLLKDILGDNTFGRLNKTLIENQEMAHFIRCDYTGYFHDPYSFTISGSPINMTDLSLLEASVESEVRRIIIEGVSDSELKKAKEQWKFESLYSSDSLENLANHFGENLSLGFSLESLEKWLDNIQSITSEEIQTAAKDILGPGPSVVAYAYPSAQ